MIVLGIFVLLLAPFFTGALITTIFRERKAGHVIVYVTGLLSLFVFFLGFLLAALKLDFDLKRLERYYFSFISVTSLLGAIFSFRKRDYKKKPFEKAWCVIIPAILLGVFSFVYLSPSVINDDTWETVVTTIYTGKIHEYSALTGKQMVAGLPIYNKIYIMPIFIACMCDFFKIPVRVMMQFLIPLIVYICNLSLVYTISKKLNVKNKDCFMLVYMLLLLAGTYLPKTGVPVTVGYALLREGYSGYAVCYALTVPLVIILLCEKKYLHALFMATSALGLLRLDRIFYTFVKEPVKTFGFINEAGKLAIIFIVCIIIFIFKKTKEKTSSIEKLTIFIPIVFISNTVVTLLEEIHEKKYRIAYLLGVSFIILSSVSFMPFEDADTLKETLEYEQEVRDIIEKNGAKDKCIWADERVMEVARRVDPSVKTLYSRSSISEYMQGLYYEDESYAWDYYKLFRNEVQFEETTVKDIFALSRSADDIVNHAYEEGLDIIIK